MKIVFVSHSPGTGGAEHSLATLIREALNRGHSVTLSLPPWSVQTIHDILPTSDRLEVVNHRWVRSMQGRLPRLSGPIRLLVAGFDAVRFASWLRRSAADIVVVNSTTIPQASLGSRLAKIPSVTMIREAIKTNPALPSFLPKSAIAWLIRRNSTATIAVSHYTSGQIGGATYVVYPDVPVPELPPQPQDDHASTRYLMAGTLSQEKGQWEAVEAVRIARGEGADVVLDFYGQASPERLTDLEIAISDAGLSDSVRHRGESRSMGDLFRSADVSIVCSKNEAFGRVTAESVNAGTPVVGYDLGGTSEILKRGGGILCEPNPASLATALLRFSADAELRARLRDECRALNAQGGVGGRAGTVIDLLEKTSNATGRRTG